MTISVDKQFVLNELRIMGTLSIPTREYHNQYVHNNAKKGVGYGCPKCKVGFWGRSNGKIICPRCGYSFSSAEYFKNQV